MNNYVFTIKAKVFQNVGVLAENEEEAKKIMHNYFREFGFSECYDFDKDESSCDCNRFSELEENEKCSDIHIQLDREESESFK